MRNGKDVDPRTGSGPIHHGIEAEVGMALRVAAASVGLMDDMWRVTA